MNKIITLLLAAMLAAGAFTASADTSTRNGVTLLGIDRDVLSKSFSQGPVTQSHSGATAPQKRAAKRMAPALAKLSGYYYTTDWGTTTPLKVARKYMVQIEPLGTDSVAIYNLMGGQRTVKGAYNAVTGVISIMPQVTYVDKTYGEFHCCRVDMSKKRYYTDSPIEFTVADDGNIDVGGWGIFVLSGANKGVQLVSTKSKLYKANAMITDKSLSQTVDSLKVRTYPACYTRESKTQIAVRNFYNCGAEVVMTIDSTGNVTMPHQELATSGTTKYYNYCLTSYTSPTSLKLKASGLTGTYADSTISFGMWAFSSSTTSKYVIESLSSSEIHCPEAFAPFGASLDLSGKGTAADPYLISTAADLETLANAVNHNPGYLNNSKSMTGLYFKQTADIDMKPVLNHEPIGIAGKAFNGTYDGQGHTISNLQQDRRSEFNAGLFGLLGENAIVSNIKLTSPTIYTTKSKAGVVAGENDGTVSGITVSDGYVGNAAFYGGGILGMNSGIIANSSYSGTVEGESMIGGVAGVTYGTISESWSDATVTLSAKSGYAGGVAGSSSRPTSVITGCHFTGSVTDAYGGGNIGGILGYVYKSTVARCWNGGQVNSSYTASHKGYVGGIAGRMVGATASDDYNSGIVRSFTSDMVGGITGSLETGSGVTASDAPIVKSCLNTGNVLCAPSAQANEIAGNHVGDYVITCSYFDNQACMNGSTEHGLSTATLTAGTAIEGFDSAWKFTAGEYPQLAAFTSISKAKLDAVPFTLKEGESVKRMKSDFTISTANGVKWTLIKDGALGDTGHGLKISGNNVSVTATTVASDTLTAMLGNDFRIYIVKVVPDVFDGLGTADSPYLLKSKDDILKLRNAIDVQLYDYNGTCFKLANDIDMGGKSDFFGLSLRGVDYAFNGTIDGDGHSIKNWQVNRSFDDNGNNLLNTENYMAGFLLYTGKNAIIKNLSIAADCSLAAGSYVAGVTSYNAGRIENCRNYAPVKALKNGASGIVGYNAADAVVSGCYNAGTITAGSAGAAGIVASNYGTLELSQNDGDVCVKVITDYQFDSTKTTTAGGLVADNYGIIRSSANQGSVTASGIVGGIAGINEAKATAEGNLSTGTVTSTYDKASVGAAFGKYSTNATTVADNYYDSQLTALTGASAINIDGVTALKTATLVGGEAIDGISSEQWSYVKGCYPVLKTFTAEPASAFNSQNYVLFTSKVKDSRFSVRNEAQIVTQKGTTPTLAHGDKFSISGNSLKISVLTVAEHDTITFTNGTLAKSYALFAAPKMLANGDGSKDNPWQIKTVDDWKTVSKYSTDYSESFDGEYIILMNDLNCDYDTTCLPLVNDGATRFQGHFEGNGKTIDYFSFSKSDSKTGINKGLFGLIGENGVVENLTLGSNSLVEGYQYVGGFAGLSAGTLRNCKNEAIVRTLKMGSAGGFAGTANSRARFINCKNSGEITSANGQCGGIAGATEDDVVIESCTNDGEITAKYSAGGIVGSSKADCYRSTNNGEVKTTSEGAGGIVGYQDGNGKTVAHCLNVGGVTSGTYQAGGIIGKLAKASAVKHSENQGSVLSGTYGAGGIVGITGSTPGLTVDSCVNHGNVTAKTYQAGGIIGSTTLAADTLHQRISHNVNYGPVTSTKQSAGGIVGDNKNYNDLVANTNHGFVIADYQAGGIAGNNVGIIEGCINTGTIEARYNVGGMAGAGTGAISESANFGDIASLGSTASTSYNVGGILGTGKAVLTDVYNCGDISGLKQTGGIVGLPVKGTASAPGTTVTNAYSTGSLLVGEAGDTTSCGNIYGGKGIQYTSYSNVYYLNDGMVRTFANDNEATGLTYSQFFKLNPGDKWTLREHCYPVVTALADSGVAKIHSALVDIDSLDTFEAVTKDFYVGMPDGVKWEVSDNLRIDDSGHVTLANITAGETATLKAHLDGEDDKFDMEYTITLVKPSSVDPTMADKQIERVEYIGVNGIVYTHPIEGVNVVRTVYSDGTSTARKVIISRKR